MSPNKKIVIVAGEESGDFHAASFVRKLAASYNNIEFSGIGGFHMENAGVHLISDLARFGVTGLSEVIRHFWVIRRAFNAIKLHLVAQKPDLLILVDYPGFNLRLAKFAKKVLNLKIIYYISPQIWAWKAGRIKAIREYIDHMAVILPFEKQLFENAGVPVSFVGNPLINQVKDSLNIDIIKSELNLPQNKRIIAMLPGSRINEIRQLMPILRDTAKKLVDKFDDLHFVIPVAASIDANLIQAYFINTKIPFTLISGRAIETVACSNCVVVASGTASLECALLAKPMCIIYKGSMLSYMIVMQVIKVKYFGLCNLLQNKMIVPELLQHDCNPYELTIMMDALLNNDKIKNNMVINLSQVKQSLSNQFADCTIDDLIACKLEEC